jgi:NTP pyrophosphatase (non-canonical NTP hydrolase)|tara:strand:- start:3183 stop:3833 length:651 start_codon:yes stop_codon:yes gene_type:complete
MTESKDVNEVLKDLNKVGLPDHASLKDQMDTDMKTNIEKTKVPTPKDVGKTVKGFAEPPTAKAKEVKARQQKKHDKRKKGDKFEVDLDNYLKFVDLVTSEESKNYDKLLERYEDLKTAGCNIARLDTAASGLVAEAGEFMEIVKKMKFQGKPYNEANKEHLIIELGDVMWYAANACMALGVRMEEVIIRNTVKLAARYPDEEFSVEKSENRADGDL